MYRENNIRIGDPCGINGGFIKNDYLVAILNLYHQNVLFHANGF